VNVNRPPLSLEIARWKRLLIEWKSMRLLSLVRSSGSMFVTCRSRFGAGRLSGRSRKTDDPLERLRLRLIAEKPGNLKAWVAP
jgi:hypothetical protein